MRDAEPESVRVPLLEFQEAEMPLELVKSRKSSPDWYPEEMLMVADSTLVSSSSVSVSEDSITVGPSPSLNARVLPAWVMIVGVSRL